MEMKRDDPRIRDLDLLPFRSNEDAIRSFIFPSPAPQHLQLNAIGHILQMGVQLDLMGILHANLQWTSVVAVNNLPKLKCLPVYLPNLDSYRTMFQTQQRQICELVDHIVGDAELTNPLYVDFRYHLYNCKDLVDYQSMHKHPYMTEPNDLPFYHIDCSVIWTCNTINRRKFNEMFNFFSWMSKVEEEGHPYIVDMLTSRIVNGELYEYRDTPFDMHVFTHNTMKHVNSPQSTRFWSVEAIHEQIQLLFPDYVLQMFTFMHAYGLNAHFGPERYALKFLEYVTNIAESGDGRFCIPRLVEALRFMYYLLAKFYWLSNSRYCDKEMTVVATSLDTCIRQSNSSISAVENHLQLIGVVSPTIDRQTKYMDDDFVAQPLAVGGKCKRNMVVKHKKRGVKVIGVVENTKDKNDTNAELDGQADDKAKHTPVNKNMSVALLKKFQKMSPTNRRKAKFMKGLNDNQREWVIKTGFGGLLKFRMERYPHRLGCNVVESFNKRTCSLILRDGTIQISESVVNKVLEWDAVVVHHMVNDDGNGIDNVRTSNLAEDVTYVPPRVNKGDKNYSENDMTEKEDDESLFNVVFEELVDEKKVFEILDKKVAMMDKIFKDCMTSQAKAVEMFPKSERNNEIKQKLSVIFSGYRGIFDISAETPLIKSSSVSNHDLDMFEPLSTQDIMEIDRAIIEYSASKGNDSVRRVEDDFFPSYSLGLTQIENENMDEAMNVVNIARVYAEDENTKSCDDLITKEGKEIVAEDETNVKLKRPRREVHLSDNLKSPYVIRVNDLKARQIKPEEEAVWQWLFNNRKGRDDALFMWIDKFCTKAQFQSLKYNSWVEGTVIDCWSYFMNDKERLKAPNSPMRLFLTVETTLVALGVNKKGRDDRYANFTEHIDMCVSSVNYQHEKTYAVGDFDMVFFPIHQGTHHYLICYDIKHPSWDIIDNIAYWNDIETMYGGVPFSLHTLFVKFLRDENISCWKEVAALKPAFVEMEWQTKENGVDCGIFVMRHMETYMGGRGNPWTGRLPSEKVQKHQLEKLRKIYCHQILTSSLNEKREEIMNVAYKSLKNNKASEKAPARNHMAGRKIMKTYQKRGIKSVAGD
ncbi:hypothetical protein POM88_043787 [Heracleum sosnowskyi]|uniref:Ubiquitin-like protease family profile domain-containing protein n=1 Tax=Heracleum sosnowskyi TaxID=360622 RepID=A0AAD8M4S8_9APIA|nr:hypothetical protein POM88_043787 [Heracleum sosnowskyi]